MKKLFCILLAAMMLMLRVSCGSGGEKDRLAEIKERGYIEITTEPYFAPYEFIDPSKPEGEQYVGMDIEIAKVIADKLGVDLKIVPLDFTPLLAAIHHRISEGRRSHHPERLRSGGPVQLRRQGMQGVQVGHQHDRRLSGGFRRQS